MAEENPTIPPEAVGQFLGIGNEQQPQDDSLTPLTGVNVDLQNRLTEQFSSQNRNVPLPGQVGEFLAQPQPEPEPIREGIFIENDRSTQEAAAEQRNEVSSDAADPDGPDGSDFINEQSELEKQAAQEGNSDDAGKQPNRLDEFLQDDDAIDAISNQIKLSLEESKFSDRAVGLGEDNIIRDMRYPIDMFEESGKMPNLISFEFFHKKNPTLNPVRAVEATASAIRTVGSAVQQISSALSDTVGGGSYVIPDLDELSYFSQDAIDRDSQVRAIKEAGLAQGNITELSGPYTSEFIAANQLNQVTDVRINRATEKSMDRVFMYVPNSLSFSDTIDYDEGSQSALRTFYEASAGNTDALKTALKLGAVSAVSSKIGSLSESIFGEAGRFDPFSSMKAQLGLATNPFNELAFKGMARKSFQFNFTFAPTSPKEAQMMQNIIQSFRFHSLPELSQSTLQYFAPHEVEVKFYRSTLIKDDQLANVGSDTFGRQAGAVGRPGQSTTTVETEQQEGGFLGFGSKTVKKQSNLVENTEIPKIGRCFITSVAMNYSPEAKSSFFVNGVPTKVDMTLSLSQALTMNRQFVLKGF